MKVFDINVRTIYGVRAVGGRHSALERFCGYADMPKAMTTTMIRCQGRSRSQHKKLLKEA